MSDYAAPRWMIAIGEELDCVARDVKQSSGNTRKNAERLRRLADILEQKI